MAVHLTIWYVPYDRSATIIDAIQGVGDVILSKVVDPILQTNTTISSRMRPVDFSNNATLISTVRHPPYKRIFLTYHRLWWKQILHTALPRSK